MPDDFEAWLERQTIASKAGLRAGISATHLVKHRPGFGQTIVPRRGSVVASTMLSSNDDEPDYFFHWLRDSALTMAVVADLAIEEPHSDWPALFDDFVQFSLSLAALDHVTPLTDVQPDHRQFLRPADELAVLPGPALLGDVRFNPDGSIDPIRWGRPQYDGSALRALACLRHRAQRPSDALDRLVRLDLDFTTAHAGAACTDLWEESSGRHYYTMLAQYAALRAGGSFGAYAAAADSLLDQLRRFEAADGTYLPSLDTRPEKPLDTAVILAALHVGLDHGAHSVEDPRLHGTLAALERQFDAAYPINQAREPGIGIALGRYLGDKYVGCGPWYLCTFAAAEFRYRSAIAADDTEQARAYVTAGDATLRQAFWTVPESGELSEQFSPADGRQMSARQLGWSHAAFLTALQARQRAKERLIGYKAEIPQIEYFPIPTFPVG